MQKVPHRVPFLTPPPFVPCFSPFFFRIGTFSYIFDDVFLTISHFPPFPPIFPHFPPFPPFFRALLDTWVLRI